MAVNDAPEKRETPCAGAAAGGSCWAPVVCLLVVIGLVSVVSGGVRLTATLFDDSELKAEYVLRLRNLVALDPVPFDSIEEANQNTLLNALIWSSISEDKDYERDEVGAMYLPTADIDAAADHSCTGRMCTSPTRRLKTAASPTSMWRKSRPTFCPSPASSPTITPRWKKFAARATPCA